MKTKLFTFLLAIVANVEIISAQSGTCGESLTWDLTNGTLTISGSGKMADYNNYSDVPWYSCRNTISQIVIGNHVASIGMRAFAFCTGLTSVIIPNNIRTINHHAFEGCIGLTSVTIGNGVTTIGIQAFYKCTSLTSINIPDGVTDIGDNAFMDCSSLVSINIPDGVTSIRNQTFLRCSSLQSATIGDGVVSIGDKAFEGCSKLVSIDIPNSVTSIGERAFYHCYSLTSATIGDGLTSIGYYAFSGCGNMTSISFGNSLTSIGSNAFRDCSKLRSVTLPNSLTNIGKSAFYNCSSLTSITIPVNVTEFGDYVFKGCTGLSSVTWNVKKLRLNADHYFYSKDEFNISKQIVSFTFGDEVEHVPAGICEEMTKLTAITIPNSATWIQTDAFRNCSNLTSVTIPASVNMIYPRIFYGCSKLGQIIMLPETPPYDGGNIVDTIVPIYVPCGALETYQATSWANYNIQYQPYPFEFNVTSSEPHKGYVVSETGNACEISSLSAIPNEGYYFAQWSDGNTDNPRNIILTKDTTIAAFFGPFTVSFVDDNDTILSSQEYEYGETPNPPTDPIKPGDAQHTYTFAGWTPQIAVATSDATYKATYSSTLNKYTITFKSEDSVLSADLWEYGTTPVYRGETPTKAEDEGYTYTFNGWSPIIVPVVADAIYTATFTATEKAEAIDNTTGNSAVPTKHMKNGNIYILMPNGKKYSIIGELIQ